jgi:hypothetical protein
VKNGLFTQATDLAEGRGKEEAQQNPELLDEAAEVVAGGGEDGVVEVAIAVGVIVAAHSVLVLEMADDWLDGRAATHLSFVLHGRSALAPVFADLNQYQATTHFNGQSTIRLDGDRATGESYCIAHHVTLDGNKRTLMIASIRYLDKFVKQDGTWLFAERRLMVDWTETRSSAP